MLEHQQSERCDTEFKRSCLFCGLVVMGNRAPLFRHMMESHGFSVGQPDNLGTPPFVPLAHLMTRSEHLSKDLKNFIRVG